MGKFIKTSVMLRAKLAEQFDVSVNWVKKSLCFKTNSKTAIKIREAALAAGGEELETSFCPDCTTEHTQDEIIQKFNNGVVLTISKKDSSAVLIRKGEVVKKYLNVTFDKWGFLVKQASLMANIR